MRKMAQGGLRLTLGVVTILAVVAACATFATAAMTMTPYLQAVTADSVYVLVESDTKDPVTVEYGRAKSFGNKAVTESTEATTASPLTYVHNIKIAGLKPDTWYYYRVSQGAAQSGVYTFVTAAEPGASFRFAWMADCRSGPDVHDQIAARIKETRPRFCLYGGDLCYDSSYAMFKQEFFRPKELELVANAPFFLAVGNHETWGVNTKAFTQAPASASGTQDYYSFDYGDVHFLCLNNEVSYLAGKPQYEFAAKDLAGTKKPWKIVFAHNPAYCAGGHGEDPAMVVLTAKVFEPNKVDLVLTGHSHFYQHNLVNGIHHLVIGTAGAPFKDLGNASYTLKSAKEYNYAVIDMTPATLHLVVYNQLGAVLDTLVLSKTAAPAVLAVPAAPTGLTASTEPGKVNLAWQPSALATSYSVKRATSDKGPFAAVKTGLTANAFTDTSVTNGSTYYYVVSAVNAKGESPDSAPVSATPRVQIAAMAVLDSGASKLLPKDDAYVNGGTKQEQNFGAETTIHVKYSNELDKDPANIKYCRISYLKFDLSQIKGKIKSAVLKLYCSGMPNGTPVPVTISAVDDDSWNEAKITWANAPKAGAKLLTAVVDVPAKTYSFDLTGYIVAQQAGDKVASLILEDLEHVNKSVFFYSKENIDQPDTLPYLEIVLE